MDLKVEAVSGLMTKTLQDAIDWVSASGGGTVTLTGGVYQTGGISLKSHVTLEISEGAVLEGSENWKDYGNGKDSWNDGLIYADGAEDIKLCGSGLIDGKDCKNPEGEEGFRGPHAIHFINCKNVEVHDLSIQNSANYAFFQEDCQNGKVSHLHIRAGHDGAHLRRCQDYTFHDCVFHTGDDGFAGCYNRQILVEDCEVNSSCNAFRFGGDYVTVRRCKLWSPGKYQHKISGHSRMLAAFVHFAPGMKDNPAAIPSDHWLIEDITVENATYILFYDNMEGLWQEAKPIQRMTLRNIDATGVIAPFKVVGDYLGTLDLTLENIRVHNENKPFTELRDDRR